MVSDSSYLYLIGDGYFKVYSISTPGAPTLTASIFNSQFNSTRLIVSGNYAYAFNNSNNVLVINLTVKTAPSISGTISVGSMYPDTPSMPAAMYVSGNYLYVVGEGIRAQLRIYDIINKSSPTLAGSLDYDQLKKATDIVVVGNYAYISRNYNSWGMVSIVDVTNKSSPTFLRAIDNTPMVGSLTLAGTTLLGVPGSGEPWVYSIDTTNPQSGGVIQRFSDGSSYMLMLEISSLS